VRDFALFCLAGGVALALLMVALERDADQRAAAARQQPQPKQERPRCSTAMIPAADSMGRPAMLPYTICEAAQ
jgi:hypothetical protein